MRKIAKPICSLGVLAVALSIAVFFALGSSNAGNSMETTKEIGASFDPSGDDVFTPATFIPESSPEEGVAKAAKLLEAKTGWDATALNLPVRTTIGLFTGTVEGTRDRVVNLKVRLVVFDNVPSHWHGGMCLGNDCGGRFEGLVHRYTMVLDDATGDFVFGVNSGGPVFQPANSSP